MSIFSLEDWRATDRETYDCQEEYDKEIRPLARHLVSECKARGFPVTVSIAIGADKEADHIEVIECLSPLHRVPFDQLVGSLSIRDLQFLIDSLPELIQARDIRVSEQEKRVYQ